jgi:uncharacterized protein (TIGR02118 family)
MIKVLAAANRHPTNRRIEDFQHYWAEKHGPLFAKTPELRRYVQHITLLEAYDGDPSPTLDGASMFWYDDLDTLRTPTPSPPLSEAITQNDGFLYDWYVRSERYGRPESLTLRQAVRADDAQLFDRSLDWPLQAKRTSIAAIERVVVDGAATPEMVKLITAASRLPGLTLEEFQQHWYEVHGPLGAKLPGLRRYVQNHAIAEAYTFRGFTHDGWAELWFDDLAALQRAWASPEREALSADGLTLFARPLATVIARERVIKG